MTYEPTGDNADTVESLTLKLAGIETPTKATLKVLNVDELKILADVLEMTYVYTNKDNLINEIIAKLEEINAD